MTGAIVATLLALCLLGCSSPSPDPRKAGARVALPATQVASDIGPASTAPATAVPTSAIRPGMTWQWQLEGTPLDETVDADVFDVDLFETDPATVQRLHAAGRKTICYMSAGTWEEWRPDAGAFPEDVIGRQYEEWPGERWLDIRQIDRLAPLLIARLDLCVAKGFDAVEPDNVDGYDNDTGFPLTAEDQLNFNRWIAGEAQKRGLSVGLKNVPDLARELSPHFDWALTEDCFAEGWCDQLRPFVDAGRAVLAAEYTDTGVDLEDVCEEAAALGFSVILKNRDIDGFRASC